MIIGFRWIPGALELSDWFDEDMDLSLKFNQPKTTGKGSGSGNPD